MADPHEIANVLGLTGIKFLIDASRDLPLDFFFMAPSCVPATHLETAGADLGATELASLLTEPRVLGLAEVMNFPGVLAGQPDVLAKIEAFKNRPIDGHAPRLTGPDLCAYVLSGIGTEHECTTLDEAAEKLSLGMRIFIRQGSQAKNLADLLPLVSDHNFRRISFCSDDRHPEDLIGEGHLDSILRRAVALGLSWPKALTMSTLNAAESFGLKKHGALAPGYLADLLVLGDLDSFEIEMVYKNGRRVVRDGRLTVDPPPAHIPDWVSPMNVAPFDRESLEIRTAGPRVRVIGMIEGQILTDHLILEAPSRNGFLVADPDRDLVRLAVVERHRATGNIGLGLVRGFGLKRGAIASSVAHDSHNIIAAGIDSRDILTAIETVAGLGGGLAAVAGGRVLAALPLPLAGLIAAGSARETAEAMAAVKKAAREIGCRSENPFMALSFLALPVIPSLKLTDRGLVDVEKFDFAPLFV